MSDFELFRCHLTEEVKQQRYGLLPGYLLLNYLYVKVFKQCKSNYLNRNFDINLID